MHIEKGSIIIMTKINETAPRPGKTIYGASLGILSLDTKFPRIHGDIGNAETPMTQRMKEGVPQASGKIEVEPVFDATHIAYAISAISKMPLDTNVLNMTIMANDMPFVGRG